MSAELIWPVATAPASTQQRRGAQTTDIGIIRRCGGPHPDGGKASTSRRLTQRIGWLRQSKPRLPVCCIPPVWRTRSRRSCQAGTPSPEDLVAVVHGRRALEGQSLLLVAPPPAHGCDKPGVTPVASMPAAPTSPAQPPRLHIQGPGQRSAALGPPISQFESSKSGSDHSGEWSAVGSIEEIADLETSTVHSLAPWNL